MIIYTLLSSQRYGICYPEYRMYFQQYVLLDWGDSWKYFTTALIFFISFACTESQYCEGCVCVCVYIYTHISDCIEIVYGVQLLTINTCCMWNIFIQIKSSAKCWLGIYHWGTALAVTGWIRDTGRNVLPSPQ